MKRILCAVLLLVSGSALTVLCQQFKPLSIFYVSVPFPQKGYGSTIIKIRAMDAADAIRRSGVSAVDEKTERDVCDSLATLRLDCGEYPTIDKTGGY